MENAMLTAMLLFFPTLVAVWLGFAIIVMSAVYMLLPLIRRILNQKEFDKKCAKRIALWNSALISLAIISVLIDYEGSSLRREFSILFYPSAIINGITYYWINLNILMRKNRKGKKKVEDILPNTENILLPQEEKEENISETNTVSEQ